MYSDVSKEKMGRRWRGERPLGGEKPWDEMTIPEIEQALDHLHAMPDQDDDWDDFDRGMNPEPEFPPMEGTVEPGEEEPFEKLGNAPTAVPFKGGTEYDALSRKSKGLHGWRPGQRKAAKSSYNRRLRHVG